MFNRKDNGSLYSAYKLKRQEEAKGKGLSPDVKLKTGGGGREDICVYSLKHGTGTSYMSAAISNYLVTHRRGNVSLVLNDTEFAGEIVSSGVKTVSWTHEGEVMGNSDYIVHDIGVHGDLSADRRVSLQRGTMKILLCKADGRFLQRLAEYVESVDSGNLVFLFNELPAEWEKKVYDLMDFTDRVWCVPTFFSMSPSTQVIKVFHEIFRRK